MKVHINSSIPIRNTKTHFPHFLSLSLKLLLLPTSRSQSALFSEPYFVRQSANWSPEETQSKDLSILIYLISLIPAIVFLNIFPSHCLELCTLSQRDLLFVLAIIGICWGFLRFTPPVRFQIQVGQCEQPCQDHPPKLLFRPTLMIYKTAAFSFPGNDVG